MFRVCTGIHLLHHELSPEHAPPSSGYRSTQDRQWGSQGMGALLQATMWNLTLSAPSWLFFGFLLPSHKISPEFQRYFAAHLIHRPFPNPPPRATPNNLILTHIIPNKSTNESYLMLRSGSHTMLQQKQTPRIQCERNSKRGARLTAGRARECERNKTHQVGRHSSLSG